MNKAVILHGTSNNSHGNWIPWLKEKLEENNWEIWTPDLPNSDQPNGQVWVEYLLNNCPFTIDSDTVLIGHSSGCVAVLGLLQRLSANVKARKAVLVSAFHTDLHWKKLRDLFNIKLDFNAIKTKTTEFIFIHSDNDPYVKLEEAQFLANQLDGELRLIKGQGHFNLEASPAYKNFPKLLSIVLHDKAVHHLYLASSFRHPKVSDLIIADAEQKLGKSGNDIKVAYITTAANLHPLDKRDWIDDGRKILQAHKWQVFDYDLTQKSEAQVRSDLAGCQVVFVQGGQLIYLLKQVQKCNFKQVVNELLDRGVVYIGESAGAILAGTNLEPYRFLTVDKRTNPEILPNYNGLGLINFLIRPHWNRQDKKRTRYLNDIKTHLEEFFSIEQPIITLCDGQLIHVEDGCLQILDMCSADMPLNRYFLCCR